MQLTILKIYVGIVFMAFEMEVVAFFRCCNCCALYHHRGVILLENETYALEPVPQSATNDHLLYLLKDVESEPFACGVVNEAGLHSHKHFNPGQTMTSLLRVSKIATCAHICGANRCF